MDKAQRGRPRRTDRPIAVTFLLPDGLRHWLKLQALSEHRSQGDVIADALCLYRGQDKTLAKARAFLQEIKRGEVPQRRTRK